jgi:eukaryotic-like serine/threonine-protein kinase
MSGAAADRNLLIGIIALQVDFISRASLIAAMNAWVLKKATPLSQILQDLGALTESRRSLLDALVEEHIKLHDDDPRKSLAAVSSIGSMRDELSRIADPEIQGSLPHVAATRRDLQDDPDRASTLPSVGDSTSAGTRFRILRPHAKGGLGEVFVARDTELNRYVALKEIQDEFADDPRYRARFEFEAEITGGLEHPSIVPVYGLGRTASGRPYYAMRFIRGDSLKEAIRRFHSAEKQSRRDPSRSTLELRGLLARFIDVCDAVAYAHGRGVLHRDLKPGNIMLGRYGQTLVVDWGLAKTMERLQEPTGDEMSELPLRPTSGSAVERTRAGSAVGTPAYMSPEQAAGRLDRLGPRSDVYCLGATLYHLLTGHAPYESEDIGELLHKVLAGDTPRPRMLNPRISPALEAVCVKAMALNLGDRYSSVEEMQADLERWLADEPVVAWREPISLRVRRWARRNRATVTGAAAALLVGMIGLSAVAIVQGRANTTLEAKNHQLTYAYAAASKARKEAETALAETSMAKRATEEALAQSENSRQRAEDVLSFLKDDVLAAARPEGQDGGLGVEVSVRKAVDAAEPKIAETFKNDPAAEADVRDTLGTTYSYLGESPLAIRQYELALDLRRTKLGQDYPGTLTSLNNLAVAYADAGRAADAIKMHEQTLILLEAKLGRRHTDTLTSRNNLAVAYVEAGRTADAIKMHEETLKMSESELGPDHPDTLNRRNNLASAYQHAGRADEAIAMNKRTLSLRESRLGPDHPDTLVSRNNLAEAYHHAGRIAEAISTLETTLHLRESKLGLDHPATLSSLNNLACAYDDAGRTVEAIKLHEMTLRLLETKVGLDHPATLQSRNNLAESYRDAGRTLEAIAMHETTLKLFGSKLGPDHPATLASRNNLAAAYESLGRWADALVLRRDVLARRRNAHVLDGRLVGNDLAGLGANLLSQAKWSEAERVLREGVAILAKATPDGWRRYDAMSLLGGALLGQRLFAEAEPLVIPGYEGLKAREAKIPAPHKPRLAEAAVRVVRLYEGWGSPEMTRAWQRKLGLTDLPNDVFSRP